MKHPRLIPGLILGVMSSILAVNIATASEGMASDSKHDLNCQSKGMVKSHMEADPAVRAKEHLSELKAKLNLTKEQEPALQVFSDQVNEQAKSTLSMRSSMKDTSKGDMPKTAPERVAMMAEAMKTKAQNMAAMAESVKTFYGALNTQQQATFDKIQMSHMGHMSSMHEKSN